MVSQFSIGIFYMVRIHLVVNTQSTLTFPAKYRIEITDPTTTHIKQYKSKVHEWSLSIKHTSVERNIARDQTSSFGVDCIYSVADSNYIHSNDHEEHADHSQTSTYEVDKPYNKSYNQMIYNQSHILYIFK